MNRIEAVVQQMNNMELDYLLLSDPSSIDYLLGYVNHPGERMYLLVLDKNGNRTLFLNKLFFVDQTIDASIVWFSDTDDSCKLVANTLINPKKVGVDKFLVAKFLLPIMDEHPNCQFVTGSACVDYVRMIKTQDEQETMIQASLINDQAMEQLIPLVINHNEEQAAIKLQTIYKTLGSTGYSFEPIIAYGSHCANPHHSNGESSLEVGQSVILDIGCMYQGYCSDMTRTVFYKEVSEKQKEVYELVKKANEEAIAYIKPGVRLCDIDEVARKIIRDGGYGEFFTHRLGHFIGKDVHEYGDVSINFDLKVEPGMIFSIEPGIYLQDEFGVRIEDLVLVTKDGCKSLNHFTKDLLIIE